MRPRYLGGEDLRERLPGLCPVPADRGPHFVGDQIPGEPGAIQTRDAGDRLQHRLDTVGGCAQQEGALPEPAQDQCGHLGALRLGGLGRE